MLQAVVGEDQIERLLLEQSTNGARAIRIDHQRNPRTLNDQQRLIAAVLCRVLGANPPRQRRGLGSIATADDPDTQPATLTVLDQPEDQRRLARATDGDVADDDNRNRSTIGDIRIFEETPAPGFDHSPVQQLQGRQHTKPDAPDTGHVAGARRRTSGRRLRLDRGDPQLGEAELACGIHRRDDRRCGVLPSALMTIGNRLSPPDSLLSAAISEFRSLLSSACH